MYPSHSTPSRISPTAWRANTPRAIQLLERLNRVKATAPGHWLAECPAHDDKRPSLSIHEKGDGLILIHCFAGCGATDVLEALALPWSALFPPNSDNRAPHPPSPLRIPPRDLLDLISHEATVIALIAADMLANKPLSETDWKRLAQAAARIAKAHAHLR